MHVPIFGSMIAPRFGWIKFVGTYLGFPLLVLRHCVENVMGDAKTASTKKKKKKTNVVRKDGLFKVIVVGNSGTGKSSFICRYVHGIYTGRLKTTCGVDFALKKIEKSPNETIRLQIWDIAGQEQYSKVTSVYYRNASACVVMFDISDTSSFEDVDKWKEDVDTKVRLQDGRPIPSLLLGNKTDLSQRCIQDEDIISYCKERDFIGWATMSVKDNTNIDAPMRFLVEAMLANESSSEYDLDLFTASDGNIRLPPETGNVKISCCR